MFRLATVSIIGVALFSGLVAAQPPSATPEHKKLHYFIGKWTSSGEMKASPMGPAGKATSTDTCEALGEFYVVCRSEMKGPQGEMKSIGILGYDASGKSYVYSGYDSMGSHDTGKGTLQNGNWAWEGESKVGGATMKTRYSMTEVSASSYTFKWEISPDGKSWTTVMEGKTTKVTS